MAESRVDKTRTERPVETIDSNSSTDFRLLLVKYVAHVCDMGGGFTFLGGSLDLSSRFTEPERLALRALDAEAQKQG